MKMGKAGKKIGAGMLFVAACFIAAFVLVEFHEVYVAVAAAGILLMASAYFLLTTVLSEKVEEWSKPEEEETPSNREDEFKDQVKAYLESSDRTQRAMFSLLKRSLEAQENSLLNLEKAVEKLAAEQSAGVKTIVRYNKENARQLAINERESISELKKNINETVTKNAASLKDTIVEGFGGLLGTLTVLPQTISEQAVSAQIPAVQTVSSQPFSDADTGTVFDAEPEADFDAEPELDLDAVLDIAAAEGEQQAVESEPPTEEAAVAPEPAPEEVMIPEPEEVVVPEPEPEEVMIPEPEKEEEAPAFDPNAKLSADDIAKLFASMTEPEETKTPEPVEEEEAPAFDPNAKLSPDDIAKLFASMGS